MNISDIKIKIVKIHNIGSIKRYIQFDNRIIIGTNYFDIRYQYYFGTAQYIVKVSCSDCNNYIFNCQALNVKEIYSQVKEFTRFPIKVGCYSYEYCYDKKDFEQFRKIFPNIVERMHYKLCEEIGV